jgi:hypothetical protein
LLGRNPIGAVGTFAGSSPALPVRLVAGESGGLTAASLLVSV